MIRAKIGTPKELLELVIALKLISDEEVLLAKELLHRGYDLASEPGTWIRKIEAEVSRLALKIQSSPYQRYLNGGTKPLTATGRLDWAAKDLHRRFEAELADLIEFRDLVNQQVTQCGTTGRISTALDAALGLVAIQSPLTVRSVSSVVVAAHTGNDDMRLCLAWANSLGRLDNQPDFRKFRGLLGDYETARLLSARIAEHAAASYYSSLGRQVEDVSVWQLVELDERWKDFDLLVDGRPVDVKNARRSFSSPDSYVQHCIPKFKISRGREVTIIGVLSDYVSAEDLVDAESRCQILGEASVSRIRRLYVWANKRFGRLLRLDGMWKPDYQPGWVFEFPEEHYQNRSETISKIPPLLEMFRGIGSSSGRLPGWLLALSPDRTLAAAMAQPGLDASLLSDLYSLDDEVGLSRPSLFILVMGLFLESIAKGDRSFRLAETLKRILLINYNHSISPLGLDDPQGHIVGLMDCLAKVQAETLRNNIHFTAFRMSHPSVLRGLKQDGSWITLFAYCGGWREYPMNVRCGATPLFFGRHSACPSCGFLVCDDCGFCSKNCEKVKIRQRLVAAEQRSRNKNVDFDYNEYACELDD